MSDHPQFVFVTCQLGAERAVKGELARRWPEFRLAFSRPGFLTFKLPEGFHTHADFDLHSVFARAYGFSLGKLEGDDPQQLARDVWEMVGQRPIRRIHVWPRDRALPGEGDFEPSITPEAVAVHEMIRGCCPRPEMLDPEDAPRAAAQRGDFVLDCVLVEPDQWWIGYHRASRGPSQWPGGIMALRPPKGSSLASIPVAEGRGEAPTGRPGSTTADDPETPAAAVSRAWLKMEEALRWSRLPIPRGARCAEIGSAPGGASQALLARGLMVTGIDPAEMAPEVLGHPNFRHIRRRAMQVRRREFRKIRWLTADVNAAPTYTLDAVEAIVTHPEVNIRGMLLTLKLPEWELADHVDEYLARVESWGFNQTRARQLVHNRREFCVAALKKPFRRKGHPKRSNHTRRVKPS